MKITSTYITMSVVDSGAVARLITPDVTSLDIPDEFGKVDMTGFGEVENSAPGTQSTHISGKAIFDPGALTGAFTVLNPLKGVYSSHEVIIKFGSYAAPTTLDKKLTGNFWLRTFNVSGAVGGRVEISFELELYGGTAPVWGVI
jgi:hypothetical protein